MKIFVASSTQGLKVAQAIQVNLEEYAEVIIWNQGVFGVSTYFLEALERVSKDVDYGVFVITPDDFRTSKHRGNAPIPRDNVIFELGLFLGSLGRRRSFLVVPADIPDLQLPSDLAGFVQARYRYQRIEKNISAALGSPCTQILQAIEESEANEYRSESKDRRTPTFLSREKGTKPRESDEPGSFIHPYGRLLPSYTGQFIRGARKEICVLGFSLRSFIGYFDSRPEAEIKRPILEALVHGASICFLFLDPESAAAKIFAKERGDKRMLADIRRSIERATELRSEFASKVKHPKMEIRVYARLPFAHIKRVDGNTGSGRLIYFPYLPGLGRADIPYLEVRSRSNPLLFNAYSRAFDNVLSASRRIA